MSVTRRWGFPWARSLPFGTYGGPLVAGSENDPGAVRAALARGLASWLERERVAGGEVVLSPPAGEVPDPSWAALASLPGKGSTHVVHLEREFEAYAAGLPKSTREGLRRAVREGVEVREAPEALPEAHALYLGQAATWSGHRPYPLPFLKALLDHPSRFARLHAAFRGSELLCAILSLSCGGERFIWWSGASQASRRTLAYPYLMVEIVRAAAGAGEKRVNLGGSGAIVGLQKYKESVGAELRPVWTLPLAPRAHGIKLRLFRLAKALRGRP